MWPITAPDLSALQSVHGWEAGLALMDRYPWAQLHAVYVHPEFRGAGAAPGVPAVGSVRGVAAADSSPQAAPGGYFAQSPVRRARKDFVRLAGRPPLNRR